MTTAFERKVVEMRERSAASIDGFVRAPEIEERINGAVRSAMGTPSGRMVMDYLRSITLNAVLPHSASDGELRMQEGMRRLFGILDARLNTTPKAKE